MKKINIKNLIFIEHTNMAYVDSKEALEYHDYEETATYKNFEGSLIVIYKGVQVAYVHDINAVNFITL